MIHQYKSHGYNIVMDVNSSAVHVVDDVVYDMIPVYEKQEDKEAILLLLTVTQEKSLRRLRRDHPFKE